jgi:sarcosine oxidase subunit gamma
MLEPLLDPCSLIRVQSWELGASIPGGIEEVLGIAWPLDTGAVVSGLVDVLCTGPTDWLVLSRDPDAGALLEKLTAALEGGPFRATNLSSALGRIEVDGAATRVLLSKGCGIDLHPDHFPPGRCARTRLAGMPVILRCTGIETFECLVTLSYRDYLLLWLKDAATD